MDNFLNILDQKNNKTERGSRRVSVNISNGEIYMKPTHHRKRKITYSNRSPETVQISPIPFNKKVLAIPYKSFCSTLCSYLNSPKTKVPIKLPKLPKRKFGKKNSFNVHLREQFLRLSLEHKKKN
jgi:hypothetical protein